MTVFQQKVGSPANNSPSSAALGPKKKKKKNVRGGRFRLLKTMFHKLRWPQQEENAARKVVGRESPQREENGKEDFNGGLPHPHPLTEEKRSVN